MKEIPLKIKEYIKISVKNVFDVNDIQDIPLEHPENEDFGDYSTSVSFILAKRLNKIPMDIAKDLADYMSHHDLSFEMDHNDYPILSSVEAASPGFINFKLSDYVLKGQVKDVLKRREMFGSNSTGQGKMILVEFSAPNPNKPLHIGHSRNNFLGSSLSSIFSFNGFNVTRMNYMNDWGTHICKSMLMYKKYGDGKEPDKKSDHFIGDFYRMYEVEHEKNPELEDELADMFKKMEAGDGETLELWKKIVNWAYEGWEVTYKNENVIFDRYDYQSKYTKAGKEIVEIALKEGIAHKDSSGAVIAKLEDEHNIPDKVLLRSDGTTIYITQDMQLAKDNYEKYRFEKRIYVVDKRQSDYFRQLFKILELLGFEWSKNLFHLSYGWVSLPEGAMSSREGTVVNADDVFKNIEILEKEEIKNSLKDINDTEDTVKKVSLAAFRYGMLKVDPKQDIVFDINNLTKFEGNTGPYLMYTYARAKSIFEKSGLEDRNLEFNLDIYRNIKLDEKEKSLLREFYKFPEVVKMCAEKMTPHIMAGFLYDFAQKFNSLYGSVPVLNSESLTRDFRIILVYCCSQILKNGLNLLGIQVVEKM
jgi:arginyl-tRNA synthetase